MRAGRTPRRRARVRHDAIGRLLVMAMVAALLVTSPTGPATPAAADGNEAPNAPAPFRGMTAGGSGFSLASPRRCLRSLRRV